MIKEKLTKALEHHRTGELDQAEALYLEVLKNSPNEANALNLLGNLKLQTKDFAQALVYLKKAVELYPNFFDAVFNSAFAYKNLGNLTKAIEYYKKAISINPQNPETYYNLANIYESINDTQNALEYYKQAKEHNVQEEKIDYFIGICNLKLKNFKEGWLGHESRPGRDLAIFTQAREYENIKPSNEWKGQNIKDKTLFVYYDSGLGDTIMYLRYLPMLKERCKKLLFKPQNALIEITRENYPQIDIIDFRILPKDVIFDVHISLMSLPYILQLNEEKDIPFTEGYLKSNPQITKHYKEKYFDTEKLKIGIKWKGNTIYDQSRAIPLKSFKKLFDIPNTKFYSLQKGEGEEELKEFEDKIFALGETFSDFSDTAAAIENLDLVICNDTSVAHLAGALGKPCWILLPFVQNWRWHNDLTYSPWYKSAKLFKQNSPNNWGEVFENVEIELNIFNRNSNF